MDNKYDEFEFVEQYLTGGEYVLWKGKPEKGCHQDRGKSSKHKGPPCSASGTAGKAKKHRIRNASLCAFTS